LRNRSSGTYNSPELRALFSVVYQEFARYGASLQDNVFPEEDYQALDNDSAPARTATRQVFERAGFGPLIGRLPLGAGTPLGKVLRTNNPAQSPLRPTTEERVFSAELTGSQGPVAVG
jgi:hypothetical protein